MRRETGGLHTAAVLLGFATFGSQILGLIRDHLLARTFGAGETLDLYYAAFRVPDFIFIAVGSLLAVTVLVPLVVDLEDKGNDKETESFLSSMLTVFTLILIVASFVAYFLMPWLARIVAPGFPEGLQSELVTLSRILLLSPFFLGLSNLFGSVSQAKKRFFLYSASPILYNLGIIFGIVFLYSMFGTKGLMYGVALGSLLHFLLQYIGSTEDTVLPRFTMNIDWKSVRLVVKRSLPRAVAMGVNQLSIVVLVAYASMLDKGSISVFNLAYNLQSVPMALIGVSYSVASFPRMVAHLSKKEIDNFLSCFREVIRHIIFLSIPVIVLFIVLSKEIVTVVFGSGNFDNNATYLTGLAVAIFSTSILFQSIVLIFDRSYYAAGRTFVPVITNIAGALVAVTLGYVFLRDFAGGLHGFGAILYLPLAFAIGVLVNMIFEWILFKKDFGALLVKDVQQTLWQSVVSTFFMGETMYFSLKYLNLNYEPVGVFGVFLNGLIAGVLGILVAVLVLKLLRSSELESFLTWRKRNRPQPLP